MAADGNGSVACTAHRTYESERLEVLTGVFWFCVRHPANAKGPDIGGSGTLEGAKIIAKADSGRCPPSRARESTFTRGLRGLH
jgi:hypothetical protein